MKKVKNMPNHRLPHLAWNIGFKLQKNHKSKILSSGWVVDIKKWFKRWDVEDLQELSSDAMKFVVIEERLMDPLRNKWKNAKRAKLEHYIANINPECWVLYKARRPIDSIQPCLITNMSISSCRALALLRTRSHSLGIEVALWNQNKPNIKACKVCKEGLIEDEYHLLFTCSAYSAIRESYGDILSGGNDLSIILNRTPRRLSSYVHALFTHRDLVLRSMNIPS